MARRVWKEHRSARDQAQRLALIDKPEAPASEIYRDMELGGFVVGGRPSQRSVERWVIKARGTSVPRWDPWSENANWRAEDIRLAFLVLREVVRATDGRIRWFSEIEARKIADIQTIAPEMPPLSVWNIARLYLLRQRNGEDTASIDEWLMFSIEPIGDDADTWTALYDEAVDKGFLRGLPQFDMDFINARPDYTETTDKGVNDG